MILGIFCFLNSEGGVKILREFQPLLLLQFVHQMVSATFPLSSNILMVVVNRRMNCLNWLVGNMLSAVLVFLFRVGMVRVAAAAASAVAKSTCQD